MANPLASVQDRFDRAQEHFDEIKTRLRAYYAEDPYVIEGKTYFGVGTERVLYAEPPEERVHTLIGELLHDLRSALDHLAEIFVSMNGGLPDDRATTFPTCKTPPAADKHGIRKSLLSPCGSDDVLRFLDDVQPYQLGDQFFTDGLWILHRLAIIDRHRHIVPRHIGLAKVNWNRRVRSALTDQVDWEADTICSDEHGAELELRLTKPDPNIEGTATLQIIVNEPGPTGLDNPDPVPLLDLLIDANEKTRKVIYEAWSRFFATP